MATTNYTVSGLGYQIQAQSGDFFMGGQFAIVQWTSGYEPRYRPLQEWTSQNLVMVNWVGNYTLGDVPTFTTTPFQVWDAGPLYIYIDFGSQNGGTTPNNQGQAWLGQITDSLALPGGDVNINLNAANIRPMMGELVGSTLITEDFNSWTPQAVPEPSTYGFGLGIMLLGVAMWRKLTSKQPACYDDSKELLPEGCGSPARCE